MSEDRDDPVAVDPVTIDGVRYEAPTLGASVGVLQDGGVIAAYDQNSGALLWTQVVYAPEEEDDEDPEVYITAIEATPDGLRVTNEMGRSFQIDLATREVSAA